MEKREQARFTKRITCELTTQDGTKSTGVVRDLSYSGLFVQTNARAEANSLVEVVFASGEGQPSTHFEAGVARRRKVHRALVSEVPNGLGLEIIPPRTPFAEFIDGNITRGPGPSLLGEAPAPTEAAIRTFRFRMRRHDRPDHKTLTIRCETEAGARARAIARAGRDWMITNVTRV